MNTLLVEGNFAPPFTLRDQDNNLISLNDFKGKRVLLYFYPKALTPGCTAQACHLRDNIDELKQAHITVIGISPDIPQKLTQFIEKKQLNFMLLSDPDHEIAEKYSAWGAKSFMGKQYDGIIRKSFLIDGEGRIEKIFENFKTSQHHTLILNYLNL